MNDVAAYENEDFVMVDEMKKDGFLDGISQIVDALSAELREVSLEIHDHPELKYKEHHAHEVLTKYMQRQPGWHVTCSAYGIATAFVRSLQGLRVIPDIPHLPCPAHR